MSQAFLPKSVHQEVISLYISKFLITQILIALLFVKQISLLPADFKRCRNLRILKDPDFQRITRLFDDQNHL